MTEYTQLRVKVTTRDLLKGIGEMGDTYDTVINKLIQERKK